MRVCDERNTSVSQRLMKGVKFLIGIFFKKTTTTLNSFWLLSSVLVDLNLHNYDGYSWVCVKQKERAVMFSVNSKPKTVSF